jgi:hypothetical protein
MCQGERGAADGVALGTQAQAAKHHGFFMLIVGSFQSVI